MFSIYKKELTVYFTSVLGFVLMGLFLLVAGVLFTGYFLSVNNTSDFSGFFGAVNVVFLFVIPMLTLRLLAEDKKLGTYELLLTSPVSSWEIIFGKFLGVFTFVAIAATILLIFPLVISFYTTVEWGAVFSGYLGLLFTLAFFISAGMFASSLTDNYVVAGLISFFIFIVFLLISIAGDVFDGNVSAAFKELSYLNHYSQFSLGLIKIKDILYFGFGTFLWLFLAKTIVESRTWK